VGTNKRYAAQIDQRMDARILERIARDGDLQTLTATELRLDRVPLTIDPRPRRVLPWARFGVVPVIVEAEACRWTADAVGIRFEISGKRYQTWVWASAVNPSGGSEELVAGPASTRDNPLPAT
jgi:hypothetical protein